MKFTHVRLVAFFVPVVMFAMSPDVFPREKREKSDWPISYSYDNGGVWRTRIPVEIENLSDSPRKGWPVKVVIPGDILTPEDPCRVFHEDGREVVFGISRQPDPRTQDEDCDCYGTVADTAIFIPFDAEPRGKTRYDVYFDNLRMNSPRNLRIPEQDMLSYRATIENGGFEETLADASSDSSAEVEHLAAGAPPCWTFDEQDREHRLFRTTDNPRSGGFCVKAVVSRGAMPSWIAARQDRIVIEPGVRYRLSGYVKGENLDGTAGWYIHLGPEGKPFTLSPMITTDEKHFDWKKLETEFTAPPDAHIADLGTVLRGSGTAWFDDVALERIETPTQEETLRVTVGEFEECPLNILPHSSEYMLFLNVEERTFPKGYQCRSTYRLVNRSDETITRPTVLLDLRGSYAHGRVGLPCGILVRCNDDSFVPAALIDRENRLASARLTDIPPRSINYLHVYYHIAETSGGISDEISDETHRAEAAISPPEEWEGMTAHPELQRRDDPFLSHANLLRNGDFELSSPSHGDGVAVWEGEGTLETDPDIVPAGKFCAKTVIAPSESGTWKGLRQTLPVEGGRSYLISAWIRCENMSDARIHIHFHRPDGEFSRVQGIGSLGKEARGGSGWVHCSEVLNAPKDASNMTLHLTSNQPGTIWHDAVSVLDSLYAEPVDVESFYPSPFPDAGIAPEESPVTVWQLPGVMKAFPQSIPPKNASQIVRASAARNEKESVQILLRHYPLGEPVLRVSELVDALGNALPAPEISVQAYVPVDRPSNYYSDTQETWYRKTPVTAPLCDGWAGMWPDPLLATDTLRRETTHPRGTNAFWLTWSIPKDAVPGVYRGTLSFAGKVPARAQLPSLPIELTVRNFTLPDQSGISATYDARFTGPRHIWGKEIDSRAAELMSENRLEVDAVKPEPRVVFQEGAFQFDWTEFDRAAERLFNELHVRYVYTPHLFYLFGWGHPPKEFHGEAPYEGTWPFARANRLHLRAEYKKRYQDALREFWNHVTEKGWADRFVLYISDEPNHWDEGVRNQMIALCEMIHEVDPDIPIYCSTWAYVPQWSQSLDVWGIGHYGIVPVETMKEIREHGSRIWFTTDGMMCLDTPYNAIERLLPHYCFKYGAEAYEFWGIGWLTFDPWKYGSHAYIRQSSIPGEYYWVRYPNGDGYLLYPEDPEHRAAVSNHGILKSVRFESAREGVEDYEYLRLLQSLIGNRSGGDSPEDCAKLEAAGDALEEAMRLVDSPCPSGRYSGRILPDPYRVEQVRRRVAEAIESLGGTTENDFSGNR